MPSTHLAVVPDLASDLASDLVSDAPAAPPARAWPALVEEFRADLRAREMTPTMISGRLSHVRRFGRETRLPLTEVRQPHLVAFLTKPEWGYRARKAHRASLVDFCAWALRQGYSTTDASDGLPGAAALGEQPEDQGDDGPASGLHLLTESQWGLLTEHPARTWARVAGLPQSGTGRVPVAVLRAWEEAGSPRVEPDEVSARHAAWERLLRGYLVEMHAKGLRSSTIKLRVYQVRFFADRLDEMPEHITRAMLIDQLGDPSWSVSTRHSHRAALVTFFSWAHVEGHLEQNPAARLPSVRIPAAVPKPAPEAIISEAINGARPDVRLMLLLGSLAGLRCGEITTLHTDHVTLEGLRIEGKGGKVRMIPVHPVLADEIAAYTQARGLTRGHFFTPLGTDRPYTTSHVGTLISDRMPPGWTAHKLRHRFASRSYAGQFNLRAVQTLLGHSSPAVTAGYVAVPDGATRDAVLAVPPVPGLEPADYAQPDTRRHAGGRPRSLEQGQ